MLINQTGIIICLFLLTITIVLNVKIKFNKTDIIHPVIIINSLKACGIAR